MISRPIEPTTTPPPATREELRTHYRKVQQMINKERRNRAMFNVGGRAEKLAECDEALLSLETLGNWIRDLLPPEPEQAALIDIQQRKGY
jgi:hypothetical protein